MQTGKTENSYQDSGKGRVNGPTTSHYKTDGQVANLLSLKFLHKKAESETLIRFSALLC